MTNEKEIQRTLHGQRGIACPCCNRWGMSPRRSKPLERRHIRRKIRQIVLDASPGLHYYTHMDNTPDYTSDLPDNFDPAWEEDIECDEYYYETSDADWWESAYGPADDGGWAF